MLGFRSFPTSFSFRRKLCFSILARVTDPSISDRVAIVEPSGATFTFGQLHQASSNLAAEILKQTASKPTTIACFQSSGASYVISSLATWKLGATLVPLSPLHTPLELDFFLSDSDTELILCSKDLTTKLDTISRQKLVVRIDLSSTAVISTTDHSSSSDTNALMIYTSGTTGKPKGVIHTHESINHMIQSLTTAWQYSETDRILHFLPLHHLHGILNKLWCVLSVGGMVEFLKSSNPIEIWERLSNPPHVTLFMAVPTIYSKMLDLYDRKVLPTKVFETAITNMGALRLMVSGSASLPIPILRRWRELTGHHLLERYGMTEVGMVLSNPLYGERKEGYVGTALPNVECRVIHDPDYIGDNSNAAVECGELVLKGKTLFKSYHNRPEETRLAFDENGWFKTGDIVLRHFSQGEFVYRILGRNSTDIIKSAGYKLSALEIEREILSHPLINDATVLGLDDETFGQIVAAIVVIKDHSSLSHDDFREYLKSRLAPYKIPKVFKVVDSIPKNQLGKVNKKTVWADLKLIR